MQSALAKRPIKNRLFSLSLDLQALIYGYVDWEDDYWITKKCRNMFELCRQDILREHMLYYWSCHYTIALLSLSTIKRNPPYFCKFCESPMFREKNKIVKINKKYTSAYASACSAMCEHLDYIRSDAGHYSYGESEPYNPGYKAYYAEIYKRYFRDPDNKFDKDKYEKLCLAYPEKRLEY